jgi:hypothetical protein
MPIAISVDVTKIDKGRFYQGKKGKYLDLILIETPKGKSDYLVKQGSTREERQSGKRPDLPIIGNATILGNSAPRQQIKEFHNRGAEDDW